MDTVPVLGDALLVGHGDSHIEARCVACRRRHHVGDVAAMLIHARQLPTAVAPGHIVRICSHELLPIVWTVDLEHMR